MILLLYRSWLPGGSLRWRSKRVGCRCCSSPFTRLGLGTCTLRYPGCISLRTLQCRSTMSAWIKNQVSILKNNTYFWFMVLPNYSWFTVIFVKRTEVYDRMLKRAPCLRLINVINNDIKYCTITNVTTVKAGLFFPVSFLQVPKYIHYICTSNGSAMARPVTFFSGAARSYWFDSLAGR